MIGPTDAIARGRVWDRSAASAALAREERETRAKWFRSFGSCTLRAQHLRVKRLRAQFDALPDREARDLLRTEQIGWFGQ